MRREFRFDTYFSGSYEIGKKPYREIRSISEVEQLIKKLTGAGYKIAVGECYADFKDDGFSHVPLKAAKKIKDEDIKQVVVKGKGGLEIVVKNEHHGSGRLGGSFSLSVEGYINLASGQRSKYFRIEEMIDQTWPEKGENLLKPNIKISDVEK